MIQNGQKIVKKIKQHVLMVSKRFPHYHSRKGELTWFEEKIFLSQTTPPGSLVPVKDLFGNGATMDFYPKLHTCRPNYERWKKKIDEVNDGKAVLVLKYWSGRPYRSSPFQFMVLGKGDVGIQEVNIIEGPVAPGFPKSKAVFVDGRITNIHKFAENDGLTVDDFCKWFDKPGLYHLIHPPEPMALIHFTNFRY